MITWRHVKPKSVVDGLSMLYCMVMVHVAMIYGMFAIAPWLKETYSVGNLKLIFYHIMGLYFYLNVMGNIYMIIVTNTSISGKMLPTLLKPGDK